MTATCLHCEISELIQARVARGEMIGRETLGRLAEVIGDVLASVPAEKRGAELAFVIEMIGRFAGDHKTHVVSAGLQAGHA